METLFCKKVRVAMVIVVMTSIVNAQGIIDGFYAAKGELSVTVSYAGTSHDEFYVGEEKVGPVPAHEKITQNIVSLYTKYGVTDGLTMLLNAPLIAAKGHGDVDYFNIGLNYAINTLGL